MKTYETRDEMIAHLIRPGDRVCELGVFKGDFARQILKQEPGQLVLVDPWKGICSSGNQDGNDVETVNLGAVFLTIKKEFEAYPTVELRRQLSFDALPSFPDEWFDLIYIDSSHSYEGTKKELYLALKKTRKGGFICGHDYSVNKAKCNHDYNFGVKEAVDEFCKDFHYKVVALADDGCRSFAIKV